jgi:hypothetical protein
MGHGLRWASKKVRTRFGDYVYEWNSNKGHKIWVESRAPYLYTGPGKQPVEHFEGVVFPARPRPELVFTLKGKKPKARVHHGNIHLLTIMKGDDHYTISGPERPGVHHHARVRIDEDSLLERLEKHFTREQVEEIKAEAEKRVKKFVDSSEEADADQEALRRSMQRHMMIEKLRDRPDFSKLLGISKPGAYYGESFDKKGFKINLVREVRGREGLRLLAEFREAMKAHPDVATRETVRQVLAANEKRLRRSLRPR